MKYAHNNTQPAATLFPVPNWSDISRLGSCNCANRMRLMDHRRRAGQRIDLKTQPGGQMLSIKKERKKKILFFFLDSSNHLEKVVASVTSTTTTAFISGDEEIIPIEPAARLNYSNYQMIRPHLAAKAARRAVPVMAGKTLENESKKKKDI